MRAFVKAEDGAATVDFVVVCAAVVLMAVTITIAVSSGTTQMADNVDDMLSDTEVSTGM